MLEPLDALLDGAGELGEVPTEPLALDEPPAAESFFVESADEEELEDDGVLGAAPAELEDEDGGVLGFTLTEPDVELEPDGAVDGVVVEPADEDDDAPGLVVAERSSPQPVSIPAPSARETATAKVVSFICNVLRGLG